MAATRVKEGYKLVKRGQQKEKKMSKPNKAREGKPKDGKRRLGIPKVTGNQSKVFLWMEHKRERATPSFLSVLK